MVSVCHLQSLRTAALLFFYGLLVRGSASTITTAPHPASTTHSLPGTCEFRTINYITDSLPQLCGKSSWSNSNISSATKTSEEAAITNEGQVKDTGILWDPDSSADRTIIDTPHHDTANPGEAAPTPSPLAEEAAADLDTGELNEASFLSFEEWKKQTLEKAGQPNANIGHKKSGEKRDSESIHNHLDSLGDEGELDLDFGAFRTGGNGEEQAQVAEAKGADTQRDLQNREGAGRQYRSKDAGKTCKERFSYASFDAGATILKTHPGAKNPKAVLIENKDSYMLSECAAGNKFLIIELSEDIWIDTLVLANYEFFSSMIRNFRVSVSDKYPVKMEKWKDIGTYEARNSREIQAFLIENPQIWARYIRIEFLSHYGNEYYCPLSLVRVHGTRMLESWRETEAIGEDDDGDEGEGQSAEEEFVPDAIADVVQEEERLNADLKEAQAAIRELIKTAETVATDHFETNSSQLLDLNRSLETASSQSMSTTWTRPKLDSLFECFELNRPLVACPIGDAPTQPLERPEADPAFASSFTINSASSDASTSPKITGSVASAPQMEIANAQSTEVKTKEAPTHDSPLSTSLPSSNANKTVSDVQESVSSIIGSASTKQNGTFQKNKTTGTSTASSSLPTIQESFFKAVSRRLQLLETNSTLSLKYIEEQSKILRDAFSKVEKKQLQKTNTFLDTLNSTVLAELRGFRQQYDEIWQSTVISLETQRDESRRENLAISARLNILADEVVFQKRMSIVQSVLLLLCLGLVIFSRVSGTASADLSSVQSRARALGFPVSPLESPPESPEYQRTTPMREHQQWLESGHRRQNSESPVSRSRSRENEGPSTPVSAYSRSDIALTPPSGGDDHVGPRLRTESPSKSLPNTVWQDQNDAPEPSNLSPSSPARTPRKQSGFIRQQASPPASTQGEYLQAEGDFGYIETPGTQNSAFNPRSAPFLSPSGSEKLGFSIARKPLPALPIEN